MCEGSRIAPKLVDFDSFLLAMHFLKCYPTEKTQEGIFVMEQFHLTVAAWYPVMPIFNDQNFAQLATRTSQVVFDRHENRLNSRTVAVNQIPLHLPMIAEFFLSQPPIIEVNHVGKGPKPNVFFGKIWTSSNTRP
jgi:hypothetical protein